MALEALEDRVLLTRISLIGHAQWLSGGAFHPVPLAPVQIWTDHGSRPLGTTRTGLNGDFKTTINVKLPTKGVLPVHAKVFAESPYASVRRTPEEKAIRMRSPAPDLLLSAGVTGTQRIPTATANTANVLARAFSINSALVMAGQYTHHLAGGHPTQIPVVFPSGKTQFAYTRIDVAAAYGLDWDAAQHEYGHYVEHAYHFADAFAGGRHFFGQPAPGGVTQAFAEGWADCFPIVAQQKEKGQVYAENIPGLYDTSIVGVDIAATPGTGENDELSVAGFFYHLTCGDQEVMLNDKTLFQKLRGAHAKTIGQAWGGIGSSMGPRKRAGLGAMLGKEHIAPAGTSPADRDKAINKIPKFAWEKNGGGNEYRLDQFVLHFYTSEYKHLMEMKVPKKNVRPGPAVEFTPEKKKWAELIAKTEKEDEGTLIWIVEGRNTKHPPTTPGGKIADYWSGPRTLIVRPVPELLMNDNLHWGWAGRAFDRAVEGANAYFAFLKLPFPVERSAIHAKVNWGDGTSTDNPTIDCMSLQKLDYWFFDDHVYPMGEPVGGYTQYIITISIHIDGYGKRGDVSGSTVAHIWNYTLEESGTPPLAGAARCASLSRLETSGDGKNGGVSGSTVAYAWNYLPE